ncbi:MAG: Do family serine endopeptidase [Candidatus Omnitrophota bacterium]|jgi:serine protease Do
MKKKILFFSITLCAGLILGLALAIRFDIFSAAESQEAAALTTEKKLPVSFERPGLEDAVIKVADTIGKAVVSISTEHTTRLRGGKGFYFNYPFGESPFGDQEPLRRFFDEFFGQMPEREYKQMGLGSGVIIDSEGYILTNEHVVAGADKITVTLFDGRKFKGEVKGRDPRADLAVIKIAARNLPVVSLGDSDAARIGQWVVAIGNPFGFALDNPEPTVTVGVISALHRSLGRAFGRDRDYNDLIQTDAAINPGNSGGPLVNLRGELLGINVAIFSTSGGYQGVGFAIPVNNAKRIISRLIEGKKIAYGWLGVTVQNLTDDLVKYFGLPDKNGVLIAQVMKNSPAEKSGMKEGDVVRKFDNQPVNSVRELLNIVGKTEVGRRVKVALVREKRGLDLTIEVGERPQEEDLEKTVYEEEERGAWRGLTVEELSPDNARRFASEEKNGVVVVGVEPGSPADEAGVIPGDIITEINKKPINSLADYEKAIKSAKSGDCLMATMRGYLVIKEIEKPEN